MSKKIILFLSPQNPNASEQTYTCPDGSQVTGVQTNEAPVKYLLRAERGVKEILCVVTPLARPTLSVFRETVKAQAPAVTVTEIPFPEGEDFAAGPLAAIMGMVKKEDEILLELTGGLRDAVMQLLLTSRALSYSGIPTAGAVYSNYGAKEIVDCSRLIHFFDLVGGMQELTSFGSVAALREYYREIRPHAPEIDRLLDAIDNLWESISLCRTANIEKGMERFNAAMEDTERCGDPLMKMLLPAFQDKYGKKLTTPGLIKWCLGSGMIQQALTVYNERIPAYLMRENGGILSAKKRVRKPEAKPYEDKDAVQFIRDFLILKKCQWWKDADEEKIENKEISILQVQTLENLEQYMFDSGYEVKGCSIDRLGDICRDYLYIKLLRNMTNHANDADQETQSILMDYLKKYRYTPLENTNLKNIQGVIERGLERLKPVRKKGRKPC